MLTPYQFSSNTPIAANDLDGADGIVVTQDHFEKEGYTITSVNVDYDLEELNGGVYVIHNNYDEDGFLTASRSTIGSFEDFSIFRGSPFFNNLKGRPLFPSDPEIYASYNGGELISDFDPITGEILLRPQTDADKIVLNQKKRKQRLIDILIAVSEEVIEEEKNLPLATLGSFGALGKKGGKGKKSKKAFPGSTNRFVDLINISDIVRALKRTFNKRKRITFSQKGKDITIDLPKGFKKVKGRSHGQPIFSDGKRFISPDKDGHNGGVWKMADSIEKLGKKETRTGIFDADLNRIKD